MALFFDTAVADEAADDAVQVVDLGDIVIDSLDEAPSPAHLGRRRRVTTWDVARLALVFALGLALSVPIVAAVRYVQRDGDGSQVDIEDRRRELPELPQPIRDPEPPQQVVDGPPLVPADATGADTDADPGGKAALKEAAAGALLPAGSPTGSTTTVPPTTTSTTPSTPAATSTTTPSVTLPDGSPNPLGPGPNGPPSGPTTTAPDPWGSDLIPGG
jgi:hypothetical protein